MWQLNATRLSFQSSRKSATTSLDRSCPVTSMARHSLLCSYSSPPQEVSLVEQELIHSGLIGQPWPSHVSQIRRLTTTGPRFASCCQKVRTNQRALLERSRRNKGIWQHLFRSHHRLLLDIEEKELAMRPRLPWNVPIKWTLCAGAHCPAGPSKARRLPRKALPTFFAKSRCPHTRRPLQITRLSTRRFEPQVSPNRVSRSTSTLSKAMIGSLRCSSHSSSRVFFLHKMLSLRAGSLYSSLAAFIAERACAFLTLTWLFGSCYPAHLSVVTVPPVGCSRLPSAVNDLTTTNFQKILSKYHSE